MPHRPKRRWLRRPRRTARRACWSIAPASASPSAWSAASGLFLTPLLGGLPQEAQDSLAAAIPFPHRLGQPEEFAALALHMIDNAYLNGEVVRLDASLRMAPK